MKLIFICKYQHRLGNITAYLKTNLLIWYIVNPFERASLSGLWTINNVHFIPELLLLYGVLANAVCLHDVRTNTLRMEFRIDVNMDNEGIVMAYRQDTTVDQGCSITFTGNIWALTSSVDTNSNLEIANGCGFSVPVSYLHILRITPSKSTDRN